MKLNTSYGLRVPSHIEILSAFGSLARCVRVTGGDMPTILFYLHNPRLIESAPDVSAQPGDYAKALQESARVEVAGSAWDGFKKPTIKAVAEVMDCDRAVAARALRAAGKWPKAVSA